MKKICTNISDYVIAIVDKEIDDFYASLSKSNEHLRMHTNEYLIQKHFSLKAIEDANNELSENNAGFVSGVSDELYDYFQKKIIDHITNTSTLKTIYKDMRYINSLIKKHTSSNKLLFKLKEPNTNLYVLT